MGYFMNEESLTRLYTMTINLLSGNKASISNTNNVVMTKI